ncbi:MAG: hemolysin III family protein, partial [Raoultibacter sp.]
MKPKNTSDSKGGRSTNPAPRAWTPSQFQPKTLANARALADEPAGTQANAENKKHNVREYTLGEEIANSVTHGVGALLSVAAIPILAVKALDDGGGIYLFAALIYTISMLMEYVMSTLYHAIAAEKAKRVFKVLDHSFIYLFIAGSY